MRYIACFAAALNVTGGITIIVVDVLNLSCSSAAGGVTNGVARVVEAMHDGAHITALFITRSVAVVAELVRHLSEVLTGLGVAYSVASAVVYVLDFSFRSAIVAYCIAIVGVRVRGCSFHAATSVVTNCVTVVIVGMLEFCAFSSVVAVLTLFIVYTCKGVRSNSLKITVFTVTGGVAVVGKDVRSFSFRIAIITLGIADTVIYVTLYRADESASGTVGVASVGKCVFGICCTGESAIWNITGIIAVSGVYVLVYRTGICATFVVTVGITIAVKVV